MSDDNEALLWMAFMFLVPVALVVALVLLSGCGGAGANGNTAAASSELPYNCEVFIAHARVCISLQDDPNIQSFQEWELQQTIRQWQYDLKTGYESQVDLDCQYARDAGEDSAYCPGYTAP